MQTFSLNELLTPIHYLHSPLWSTALHMMNTLSLVLAMLYTSTTKHSRKIYNIYNIYNIYIIAQTIYFFLFTAYSLVYIPYILRIGSEYFYEFILQGILFILPIILVVKVYRDRTVNNQ